MRTGRETEVAREPRLDDKVLDALEGLPGRIAFSGLRRVLGAHPESLARALRRLEREGLIERVDGGYRRLSEGPRTSDGLTSALRPIAQVDLPPGLSAEALAARLTGRWFGSLRWVGVVEQGAERLLAWARRDGTSHVLLGVERSTLRVYVRDPGEGEEGGEAEDAAYELLFHAVEALRPETPSNGSATWLAAPTDPLPWATGDN